MDTTKVIKLLLIFIRKFLPMKKNLFVSSLFISIFFFYQCTHKNYCVSSDATKKEHIVIQQQDIDSATYKFILPYKTNIDKDLNVIIAHSSSPIEKNSYCNNLAQLVFESMQWYADSLLSSTSNFYVLINYGGLRANIPAGNISKKHIFEVMPFDNSIVILKLNDETLKQLISQTQSNNKLLLKSKNTTTTSILVTSDYLYQGGDGCTFLKSAQKLNSKTYFIRDAIIRYCSLKKELSIPCFH